MRGNPVIHLLRPLRDVRLLDESNRCPRVLQLCECLKGAAALRLVGWPFAHPANFLTHQSTPPCPVISDALIAASSQANLSIGVNVHDRSDPIGRYALDALRSLSLPQAYQSAAREGWQPAGRETGILFHPVAEENTSQGRAWCQEREITVATDSGSHIEHYTNCKHIGLTGNTHYVIEITNAPGKRQEVDRIATEILGKIRGLGFAQLIGQ